MPPNPPFPINCRVAHLDFVPPLSAPLVAALLPRLKADIGGGSHQQIQINFVPRPAVQTSNPPADSGPVNSARLHYALGRLVPNVNVPINTIGLLFARSFINRPDVLGMMFDTGFLDPTAPASSNIPREGCAVFLDSIAAFHGALGPSRDQSAAFQEELRFTTTHEIGHVFNLGHVYSPPNFMMQSDKRPTGQNASAAFGFLPNQQKILSLCPDVKEVRPGNSRWGDLGSIDAKLGGEYVVSENRLQPYSGDLRLEIHLDTKEFHYYQPVELDISVHLARHAKRKQVKVADRIDCGYADFNIWIENPDGEIRLYRPINYYCSLTGSALVVKSAEPFRRDVSIFGQSGGFTFSRAGIHRLRASFRLSSTREIWSEPLEINVRSIETKGPSVAHQKLVEAASPALFYRSGNVSKKSTAALDQLAKSRSRTYSLDVTAACYSLGRLNARNAISNGDRTVAKVARRLLSKVADHPTIGINRRRIATQLLEQL